MRISLVLVLFLLFSLACEKNTDPLASKAFGKIPDYNWVFPEAEMRNIVIQLGQANWEKIQKDMEYRTARKFGSTTTIPGAVPPAGNGNLDAVPGDPIYVEADVLQGSNQWKKVGFRLKGNASLNATWRSGVYKLPFKIQFDEFEDTFTETKNQRFYGFKELSFAPSYGDNTFMKEKLLTDLFRKAGVMACKVAYYKVYIDFGQGQKYCGIYQAIETVEEHMVEIQSGLKVGNVYKPESNMQTFITAQFEKQNNKELADYSDVKNFISALNSPLRVSNRPLWKKQLEAVFDVKSFLKYLAVNNTVGNWDNYGQVMHNYFLANTEGVLRWIPYDLNLSFQMKGGLNRTALTMEMNEVGSQWPLIRYLIDDPEYFNFYKAAVKDFVEKYFTPTTMNEYIKKHKTILAPSFTATEIEKPPYSFLQNPQSFEKAVSDLEKYINERYIAASAFTKD
ncbi:CotH kinase family protein [Emticicia sp. W12TSBA100-4]|uniref:CotH kinase family protein n=1 Tax=Emticicia sp. W12TSBA100-4 TaxID=3160965 RepID=UPI0033060506